MALAGREKSMGFVWFLLAIAMLGATGWYVYDEAIGRRTWKKYAAEWNQIETERLQKEIAEQKKKIDPKALKQIKLEREKAKAYLESKEYAQLQEELKEKKIAYDKAAQSLQFAKADQDEVFYKWKHAQHSGHDVKPYQKHYDELSAEIKKFTAETDQAEKGLLAAQEKINAGQSKLKELDIEEANLEKEVAQLEKQLEAAQDRGDPIEQYVLPHLGKYGPVIWGNVDRCTSCHIATLKPGNEKRKNPFKTHPHLKEIFSAHPVEKYGCVTCHGGQGEATQIKGAPFSPGDHAHGFSKHWLNPLLGIKNDFVQSSCNKCHIQQWKVDLAPVYTLGKQLFVNAGCVGCHKIKGLEWATDKPHVGPDLGKIKEKVYPEWLFAWVKKPTGYLPHTRMPQPPWKNDEEIIQTMAYILDSSEPFNWKYGKFSGGNAEQGKVAFEKIGCIACHNLEGKGGGRGPALDRIAEKTSADWIYNWIQEPKNWSHIARMPSLRLSSEEAANITAYLASHGQKPAEDEKLRTALKDPKNIKEGFRIINTYGCYGCHMIKGFENMSKPSVELTNFGRKDVHELAFGDAKIPETWMDWADGKLRNPQMFVDERSTSFMPKPNVNDEERHALVVFLKGQRPENLPEEYIAYDPVIEAGRELVNRYNCQACHLIEGQGQEIEQWVKEPNFLPPNLASTGARLQTKWMFGFLKNPGDYPKVRSWLNLRMPTFGFSDHEAQTLVEYFKRLDKVDTLLEKEYVPTLTPESYQAAQKLMSSDVWNCYSCHISGNKYPNNDPNSWAPNLEYAHERIRAEWLNPWIHNAPALIPGTRMPAFYPEKGVGPQDILGGDDEKQVQAIVNYVMSLGRSINLVSASSSAQSSVGAAVQQAPPAEMQPATTP